MTGAIDAELHAALRECDAKAKAYASREAVQMQTHRPPRVQLRSSSLMTS